MGERQKPAQKKPRKNELKSNIAQRNSLVEEEVPGAILNKFILLTVFLFVVLVSRRTMIMHFLTSYQGRNMLCFLRLLTGADFH